jgi:hypothetical protein
LIVLLINNPNPVMLGWPAQFAVRPAHKAVSLGNTNTGAKFGWPISALGNGDIGVVTVPVFLNIILNRFHSYLLSLATNETFVTCDLLGTLD